MRWPARSPWWPPLIAAAVWFLLACPIANRALRGLDFAAPTRLLVIAIASLPVIGALRALIDGRIAAAADPAAREPAAAHAAVSPATDGGLEAAQPPRSGPVQGAAEAPSLTEPAAPPVHAGEEDGTHRD